MKIILASKSKNRRQIMDMIGLNYEVMVSDEEEVSSETKPDKYVMELSLNKANNIKNKLKDKAIIIACDTVIYFNNKIIEKPKSIEEAKNNLKELSGNVNVSYTGLTIIDMYQDKVTSSAKSCEITFKRLSDDDINWYINSEENIYNSCGYVPNGKASIFIESVQGDYNVLLGLSPSHLFNELKNLGYELSDFDFKREYEK